MIRELLPLDVGKINVQPKQQYYKEHISRAALTGGLGDAFVYDDNGDILAAVGMQVQWKGRALVWALIGEVNNWIAFHRAIKSLMESYALKHGIIRLEMTTEEGFTESERWARMLGFKEESLMCNYAPDGKNHKMWVRLWQQQSRL